MPNPPSDLTQRYLVFYKLSQIRSPLVTASRSGSKQITSFETYLRKQGLAPAQVNLYCEALEADFRAGRKRLTTESEGGLFPPAVKWLVTATLVISILYLLVAAILSWMPNRPMWSWRTRSTAC